MAAGSDELSELREAKLRLNRRLFLPVWPSFRILINVCVCGGGCYRGALQREQMAARKKKWPPQEGGCGGRRPHRVPGTLHSNND